MWPYKGLYWHVSVDGLGQKQTEIRTAGSLGCFFFLPAVVVYAVSLSDYRFTAKDCGESDSAAGEYEDSEQHKHCLGQFFSSFTFFKQKVSIHM